MKDIEAEAQRAAQRAIADLRRRHAPAAEGLPRKVCVMDKPTNESEAEYHDRLVRHLYDTALLWAKDRWPAAARGVHLELATRAVKATLLRLEAR